MRLALIITTLIMASAAPVLGQVDLSAREALYFTGKKATTIDLKSDVYAAKDRILSLSTDQATSCANTLCEFNVGIIGFRNGNDASAVSTYGLISLADATSAGNTIYFGPNEKTKQLVVPLKLKPGRNLVNVSVDPYKKTAETNESNNTFRVIVVVNPAPDKAARQGKN